MTPKIEAANAEARQLGTLSLQELRIRWCSLYGLPCPKLRSADLLRRLLAWRLQAEAEGGLDGAVSLTLTCLHLGRPNPLMGMIVREADIVQASPISGGCNPRGGVALLPF